VLCVKTLTELISNNKKIKQVCPSAFLFPKPIDYDLYSANGERRFVKAIYKNLDMGLYTFKDNTQKDKFCFNLENPHEILGWKEFYLPLTEMNKILLQPIINKMGWKGPINEFEMKDIDSNTILYADQFYQIIYYNWGKLYYYNINEILKTSPIEEK